MHGLRASLDGMSIFVRWGLVMLLVVQYPSLLFLVLYLKCDYRQTRSAHLRLYCTKIHQFQSSSGQFEIRERTRHTTIVPTTSAAQNALDKEQNKQFDQEAYHPVPLSEHKDTFGSSSSDDDKPKGPKGKRAVSDEDDVEPPKGPKGKEREVNDEDDEDDEIGVNKDKKSSKVGFI